jgi:hypothetical protein
VWRGGPAAEYIHFVGTQQRRPPRSQGKQSAPGASVRAVVPRVCSRVLRPLGGHRAQPRIDPAPAQPAARLSVGGVHVARAAPGEQPPPLLAKSPASGAAATDRPRGGGAGARLSSSFPLHARRMISAKSCGSSPRRCARAKRLTRRRTRAPKSAAGRAGDRARRESRFTNACVSGNFTGKVTRLQVAPLLQRRLPRREVVRVERAACACSNERLYP